MTPTVLDLAAARRWAVTSRSVLSESRERIDRLNVFPVPDGDTGTNMFLTVDGALGFLRERDENIDQPVRLTDGLDSLARGMLLSARGNSGVILSQLAQGMAQAMRASHSGADVMDAKALAEAFRRAADLAWAGVSSPVEGTILSVARAAAEGAAAAVASVNEVGSARPVTEPNDPGELLTSQSPTSEQATYAVALGALLAAREALALTPEQLPSLARAGVVDAGGAGFVLVLEALESVLADRPHDGASVSTHSWLVPPSSPSASSGPCGEVDEKGSAGEGAFEVMYLLEEATLASAEALRQGLVSVGNSVMVVGGPTQWRVHVHLDHPGSALDAGSQAGRVQQVSIMSLVNTSEGGAFGHEPAALGLVCCAPGEAIGEAFSQAGAIVVASSAGHRASTGELLRAARRCPAARVAILPNDPDTILAAQAAARAGEAEGLAITVLPTLAVVQGLAAISVWDPDEPNADDTLNTMIEAAAHVAYGALTIADSDGFTPVGQCVKGQWLGLVGGEIVSVNDVSAQVVRDVLDGMAARLIEPPEIVTVLVGGLAEAGALDNVIERWGAAVGEVEIRTLAGGQRTFHWLLGLE